MPFDIIVGAHSSNMAIGAQGKIPWKCRADMKFFKDLTTHTNDPTKINAIIMGRNTHMSIKNVLPNRLNVVLTKTPPNESKSIGQLMFCNDFDTAIDRVERMENI